MSRKSNCYDNAAMESFFASLKIELVYAQEMYLTRDIARVGPIDYIEVFNNRRRIEKSLGNKSQRSSRRSSDCLNHLSTNSGEAQTDSEMVINDILDSKPLDVTHMHQVRYSDSCTTSVAIPDARESVKIAAERWQKLP